MKNKKASASGLLSHITIALEIPLTKEGYDFMSEERKIEKLKYDDMVRFVEQGLYQLAEVTSVKAKTPIPDGVMIEDFVVRGGSLILTDNDDPKLSGTLNAENITAAAKELLQMQGGDTDLYNEFGELNINFDENEAEVLEIAAFGKIVYTE